MASKAVRPRLTFDTRNEPEPRFAYGWWQHRPYAQYIEQDRVRALFEYFSMPYQTTFSFQLSFLVRALVQKSKILLLCGELRAITPFVARFRF